jgi:hypothetical protein
MNLLEMHCKAMNLPAPVLEYKFHPKRRWKIDAAWPGFRLAVEIEGGLYGRGAAMSRSKATRAIWTSIMP